MIYLTYKQDSGGRSGHKLKDIFSVFIISFFNSNFKVCYDDSWGKQDILNNIDIINRKDINYDKCCKISDIKKNKGITYEKFLKIIDEISNYEKNTLVEISNRCRIHPCQLHNWYIEKKINRDYFTLDLIPLLKKFYYGNKKNIKLNNVVSIHIRRGDIFDKIIERGWNINYYKNIISLFNKYLNIPINIYTEDYNYEDLLDLKDIKNVNLNLGNTKTLKSDIDQMISSKYLFITSSGLSTWMAYISKGSIFIPKNLRIKHFYHLEYPSNVYYTDDIEKIIS